ncbi:hypothetical protein [Castellaniella sp.]|uniref:hypothetical protein n=1 Tax=Castellaniella sp. TaxID=1955812 RepID=UPI003C783F7F
MLNLLAESLSKLTGEGTRFASIVDLAKRSGVGKSTIDRAKKCQTVLGLDNLEAIATASGFQAWQLICPDFDPKAPPRLMTAEDRLKQWPLDGIIDLEAFADLPAGDLEDIREYVDMKVRKTAAFPGKSVA